MTGVNTGVLTAAIFIPACSVAYIDLMTSMNTGNSDVEALKALAARLHPTLTWRPVRGPGLLVGNGVASMATVVTIVDGGYAAEIESEQPLERLAPLSDPDTASKCLSKMLVTVSS